MAAALKNIYKAKDADAGKAELDDFADGPWGQKYPAIAQSWRRNWPEVIPFFAFPDDVRRIIYTTNAIESLNAKLRRAVRTRQGCSVLSHERSGSRKASLGRGLKQRRKSLPSGANM